MAKSTNKKSMLTSGLAVGLAALMLIGGGTFAYLRDTTPEKVNNFETNNVDVKLEETENDYSIVPGEVDDKDPTVHVDNSVDAYVYVQVIDNTDGLVTYEIADGWLPLDGVENVYYQFVEQGGTGDYPLPVLKDNKVFYSKDITNEDMKNKDNLTLSFIATAMQVATFEDKPVAAYFETDNIVEVAAEATAADINTQIAAAVESGEKAVVMIANDVESDTPVEIPEGSNVTISLDNAIVTNTKKSSAAINNSGDLTVMGGTLDATAHGSTAITNEVGATATLEGVTLTRSQEAGTGPYNNGGNSCYVITNSGTMTLTNCVVEADGKFSSLINNEGTEETDATLTINGGTYSGGLNTIKNSAFANLVVNGGTFTCEGQQPLLNFGTATINDGTFVSINGTALYNWYYGEYCPAILNINGGTYECATSYDIVSRALNGVRGTITMADGIDLVIRNI